MDRIYELAPEAEVELADARDAYEAAREGLGLEFLAEMQALVTRIASMPERYPVIRGTELRRAVGKRFPYMIVFKVRGDVVRILAVTHRRRRPGYWSGRT